MSPTWGTQIAHVLPTWGPHNVAHVDQQFAHVSPTILSRVAHVETRGAAICSCGAHNLLTCHPRGPHNSLTCCPRRNTWGLQFAHVSPTWKHVGLTICSRVAHVGPQSAHVSSMWGPQVAHVSPTWTHVGPQIAHVSPTWIHVGPTCHSRVTYVSSTCRSRGLLHVAMPYYIMVKNYTKISNAKIPCSISKKLKLVHANKSRLKVKREGNK